jgi:hypothetical protein
MLEMIVAIGSICVIITGAAIWSLRASATDVKTDVKTALTESISVIKQEFKEFTKEVDRKLEGISLHHDQKVEGVKSYARDVDIKTDRINEKLHEATVEMLQFQKELPEEFVTRREWEEIKKRVIRLEGSSFDPK